MSTTRGSLPEHRESPPRLVCQIFDRETAWCDTWSELAEQVDSEVRLIQSYIPLDITEPRTWQKVSKYLEADLVTMIYFISEVCGLRDEASPFFVSLMSSIKPGAICLFVDNNARGHYGWFDELAAAHGLSILNSGEGMEWMPGWGDKADLGHHFKKLADASPKLRANVAWRIARKV